MQDAGSFCRAMMHEYERQWSRGGGHAVRHPLKLKMDQLQSWCDDSCSPADFDARLEQSCRSNDPGVALLADELLPLWRRVRDGGSLSFDDEA